MLIYIVYYIEPSTLLLIKTFKITLIQSYMRLVHPQVRPWLVMYFGEGQLHCLRNEEYKCCCLQVA